MKVRTLDSRQPGFDAQFAELVAVDTAIDREIDRVATAIIDDVRTRGDAALLEYTNRFDRMRASSVAELEIPAAEMQAALDYVSKRYHVSTDALEPIFATAQSTGKELKIDPLLIIAIIGIESGFNPFSQSVVGAKGLMQVMPNAHMDKLPDEADDSAFLDPVTNVQVGTKVLHESIRRFGGIENGLQQFAGALNDPDRRYATKVLAEKQRLDKAAQQHRRT